MRLSIMLAPLLLALLPVRLPAQQPAGIPQLKLSQTTWDFGTLWYGDPCETNLEISNAGTGTLKLLKVDSTCGCTVPQPEKRELGPGEKTRLRIRYNTKKNQVNVSQSVTIETNDPAHQTVRILVKGRVNNVFSASPTDKLAFGQLLRDSQSSRTIELTCNLKERVTLAMPSGPTERFKVRLEELERGQRYRLTAATLPPLKHGTNYFTLKLKTSSARFPTMDVPLSAYAMERVEVSPPSIVLSNPSPRPVLRTLRVNYLPAHPMNVTGVSASDPSVQVKLIPDQPRAVKDAPFAFHQLQVTILDPTKLPAGGATIDVQTDDADAQFQHLTVPVEIRNSQPMEEVHD